MLVPEEFYRQLREKNIPPLVLLYGQESYLVGQAAKRLRRAVLAIENDEFNDHQFTAKEVSASQILEAAMTFPVFAERKLVTIKDAHQLAAADMDQLSDYLDDPVPETCLLLIADKIDSRRKFFQKFKKLGTVVEFKPLAEKNMPQFVRQELDQRNINISADALALLCGLMSGSLYEVHAELDKLINYIGDRKLVDVKDVEAVISRGRAENVFELGKVVGQGNAARALILAGRLSASGEPPLRTLSLLVRHFRQLWKVRELQVQKRSSRDIAKVAGVPYFVVDGLVQQGKRFSKQDFVFAFNLFIETDLAMKSSGADAAALLDLLVLRLAKMKDR